MKWILLIILIFTSCSDNTDSMRLFQQSLTNAQSELVADFRTAAFNIRNTFGPQSKKDAIERHVLRSNADIVTFTETSTANFAYIQSQYAQYGYIDYAKALGGGNFQLMMMSKFPITYQATVSGGGGFPAIYVEITIQTETVGILSIHTYPDCISAPCRDEETDLIIEPAGWNRMVQMQSYVKFLEGRKVTNPFIKSFIIQGDYNEDPLWNSPNSYASQESGGFALPTNLSLPLVRGVLFPDSVLNLFSLDFTVVQPADLGGNRFTIWTLDPNPLLTLLSQIDYISHTDGLQLVASEVLSGDFDANTGMLKAGNPVTEADSRAASDHKLVMADFKIN